MLRSFNQPSVPVWMSTYIQQRVGKRAAYISGSLTLQLEISKSQRLIGIEERYRADQIKKGERSNQGTFSTWH